MRVKDAIKELQNLDPESFIALSYWDQDAMQESFLDDDKLTDDEWEEITDSLTYECEDFTPNIIRSFFESELALIRSRQKRKEIK